MRQLPFGLTALLASLAATGAMLLFNYFSGAALWGLNIFRTPIPYALLFMCWFVVTPAYLLLRPWVRLRLPAFLLFSAAASSLLFLWRAKQWGWHPMSYDPVALGWIIGFPLVGAVTYWSVLKLLASELND